jgi:hypothetical protein
MNAYVARMTPCSVARLKIKMWFLLAVNIATALFVEWPPLCDYTLAMYLDKFNTTFCNSFAFGLENGGILTPDNVVRFANRTVVTYYKVNETAELWIEYRNNSFWLNGQTKFLTVIEVVPGTAAYNPPMNEMYIVGRTSLNPTYLGFMTVNLLTGSVSTSFVPNSNAYNVIWDGSALIGIVISNGLFQYKNLLMPTALQSVGNATNAMVMVDIKTSTFTYYTLVDNIIRYCSINCTIWADRTTYFSSEVSTLQVSSSLETTLVASTAAETVWPTSQTTLPALAQFVWIDTIYIPDFDLPLFVYPGTFVIPPDSTIRIDLSGVDVVEGQVIPLFAFSALEGSFAAIDLRSTSCTALHGELQTTQTTMNIIVTSSTSVCAASIKLAIDPL